MKYESDYGATLFLNGNIQKQIKEKCGDDILFCMPSTPVFICAPYSPASYNTYAKILRELMKVDKDINRISNLVYRRDSKGIYTIVQ